MSSLIAILMDYYSLTPGEKTGEFISSVTPLAEVTAWIISTFSILFSSYIWSKMYVILRKQQLILIPLTALFLIDRGALNHILQSFEGQEIMQRKHYNYAGVAIL